MRLEIFENKFDLVERAYEMTFEALDVGLAENGEASIMCSGGSTPGPLYERLSVADLDWSRITIGLADDRWVDPASDFSNEKLVHNTLLKNRAEAANFLPMKTPDIAAKDAVEMINERYSSLLLPIDVMILGMGPDGHSLSWFPDADGLAEAVSPQNENLVASIIAKKSKVTGENLERMTLTYKAVAQSREVILMMTGDDKREVLEGDDQTLPIRFLQEAAGDRLTVLWAP